VSCRDNRICMGHWEMILTAHDPFFNLRHVGTGMRASADKTTRRATSTPRWSLSEAILAKKMWAIGRPWRFDRKETKPSTCLATGKGRDADVLERGGRVSVLKNHKLGHMAHAGQ
jgi:hypothetical protein